MAARKTQGVADLALTYEWENVEEWDGLVKGDLVLVKGERGDWRFQWAKVKDGEVTEVTVHGGPNGHGSFRTFLPNRVSKPKVRNRRPAKA
jgi:hypothetical protein